MDLTLVPRNEWAGDAWNGYVNATPLTSFPNGCLVAGPAQLVRAPFTTPAGQTLTRDSWWTTFYWFGVKDFTTLNIEIGCDVELIKSTGDNVDVIIAPNRLDSLGDSNVFTCTQTGNVLTASFDGTAGGSWTYAPKIVGSYYGLQPLFAIGSHDRQQNQLLNLTDDADAVFDGVRKPVLIAVSDLSPNTFPAPQSIDWAVKSATVAAAGNIVRTAGTWMRAMSWSKAVDRLVENWPFGPINTFTSSDYRDYSTQRVDFAGIPPANGLAAQPRVTEQTNIDVLPRLITNQATQTLQPKAFGGTTNLCPRWGDVNTPTAGNLLIDDAAVDTLATSDGSAGTTVNVMVHGTICAPAEGVRLGEIRTTMKVIGGHRRIKGGVQ